MPRKTFHSKPISGKQKKQMLKEERAKKANPQLAAQQEQEAQEQPKADPNNFFLKFINDSDQVVDNNKKLASEPFNFKNPMYKIDQLVYLQRTCCPALPIRPANALQMDKEQYDAIEAEVFTNFFTSISPDLKTIATQYCQFEMNKNVYREVWRVTERSNLICLITDARFPLAHIPISFIDYLKTNSKPMILLINKADLVSKVQVEQWVDFFTTYFKKEKVMANILSYSALQLVQDTKYRGDFLYKIISTARNMTQIQAPSPITIGFMGQPSVGKSKTMNGLLGHQVTAVRLTAGCTKHLQTYYLKAEDFNDTRETDRSVLFCDCPGLVLPVQGAPRPLQIVTGVFPTGRVREFYSPVRLLAEWSPTSFKQIVDLIDFQMIKRKFNLEIAKETAKSPLDILNCLAYQLGFLNKGNSPWAHKAGLWLLSRVTEGAFVYEVPVSAEAGKIIGWVDKWAGAERSVAVVLQSEEKGKEKDEGEGVDEEEEEGEVE